MDKDQIGQSIPRLESAAKVAGTVEYIHNLELPGMLHGKVVRSVLPHARVVGVDRAGALEVPGVRMVVTHEDVARVTAVDRYGPAFSDQPVLAVDKVRHVGEPVAVVVADTPQAAAAGADAVAVDYEELPAVYDEVEAAAETAPLLHDEIRASASFADLKHFSDRAGTNVNLHYALRRGDVARGLEEADRVFEHTFRTPPICHTALEPLISVAELGDRGTITVHSATQNPSIIRVDLARLFGVPENKVKVRTAFLGGGFGGKLYPKLEPIAAVCARLTRRPVRIALTMDEQFFTGTRHATTTTLRTGVMADGTIVARKCQIWWNTGAYADIGPRVVQKSGATAAGPYDIEHVWIDSYCVYTNLPPAGALRGFGVPQVAWAYESQADLIARELGLDPLEFRRRNVLRNGRPHATGTVMRGAGTVEVLDEMARAIRWDDALDRGDGTVRRGRGIALGIKAVITPSTSGAIVSLGGDGSCTLYCGTVDMGQGSDTVFAQMTAEILGIGAEEVAIVHADTATTPYDMGTLGSRSTYHMGNAVRQAATDARQQLLELGAEALSVGTEDLDLVEGHLVARTGDRRVPLAELVRTRFKMQAGNIIGTGSFTPAYTEPEPGTGQSDNFTAFWMAGGTAVEVSVDTDTGALTIDRVVTVGDVGRALNPGIVRTQLNGAAVMGLGATVAEEMQFEDGQLINTGLAYYKVPGIMDLPAELEARTVELPDDAAPFGAKGVGETGTFAISPAVANAVHDAVGVRVFDLPLTTERIWRGLREVAGRPGTLETEDQDR